MTHPGLLHFFFPPCRSGWPVIYRDLPAFPSWVLELKAYHPPAQACEFSFICAFLSFYYSGTKTCYQVFLSLILGSGNRVSLSCWFDICLFYPLDSAFCFPLGVMPVVFLSWMRTHFCLRVVKGWGHTMYPCLLYLIALSLLYHHPSMLTHGVQLDLSIFPLTYIPWRFVCVFLVFITKNVYLFH